MSTSAVWAFAAVHDTPSSRAFRPPAGVGVLCIFQEVPFHFSAHVLVLSEPTASHAVEPVHDTPSSRAFRPPAGVGVLCIFQEVPFHFSAHVLVLSEPTASHAVEDVHDTTLSWLVVEPDGCGVLLSVHFVPFQCAANGVWFPEPTVKNPTVMHALVDGHDTLIRKLCTAPAGLGVDWTVQFVPFQRSASVFSEPPLATSPTAVHTFAPLQDTPLRLLFDALGVVPTDQNLPFQVSTTASKTPPLSSSPPTAVQKVANGHDTVCRSLARAPDGTSGG